MKQVSTIAAALTVALLALSASGAWAGGSKNLTGKININTASIEELTRLPMIGPKKAQKIVAQRKLLPFKSPEELMKVKGIGAKLFAKISKFVVVDGATTLSVQ